MSEVFPDGAFEKEAWERLKQLSLLPPQVGVVVRWEKLVVVVGREGEFLFDGKLLGGLFLLGLLFFVFINSFIYHRVSEFQRTLSGTPTELLTTRYDHI